MSLACILTNAESQKGLDNNFFISLSLIFHKLITTALKGNLTKYDKKKNLCPLSVFVSKM